MEDEDDWKAWWSGFVGCTSEGDLLKVLQEKRKEFTSLNRAVAELTELETAAEHADSETQDVLKITEAKRQQLIKAAEAKQREIVFCHHWYIRHHLP